MRAFAKPFTITLYIGDLCKVNLNFSQKASHHTIEE